jgi:hypothetical protein
MCASTGLLLVCLYVAQYLQRDASSACDESKYRGDCPLLGMAIEAPKQVLSIGISTCFLMSIHERMLHRFSHIEMHN